MDGRIENKRCWRATAGLRRKSVCLHAAKISEMGGTRDEAHEEKIDETSVSLKLHYHAKNLAVRV